MDKYYTPSIEEFRVGFEFEFRHSDYKEKGWIKYTTPNLNIEEEDCPFSCIGYSLEEYRVKYLDQSDIESLGFILNENSNIYHKDKYTLQYCQSMNNHVEVYSNIFKEGYNDNLFNGKVKNKSELKVLLKQLGIE
jgi:hypothetical protein